MVQANHQLSMQVAETGNKRKGQTGDDVTQCLKDLSSWFKEKASSYHSSKLEPAAGKATADDVSGVLGALGLPAGSFLGLSVQTYNGGLQYLNTMIGVPLDQIKTLSETDALKQHKAVAFAQDCMDETQVQAVMPTADGGETVVTIDTSDNTICEDLK